MKVEDLVPDGLWSEIEPLLPPPKPRRRRNPGRKPMDRRKALIGILYVLKTGIPWEYLPQEIGCGCGMSCWRYLRAWQQQGVWQKIHEVLLARLRGADKIDFSRAIIDSSSVRAVLGGGQNGAEPDRPGEKRHQTPPHRGRYGDTPCGHDHGSEPARCNATPSAGGCDSRNLWQTGSAP